MNLNELQDEWDKDSDFSFNRAYIKEEIRNIWRLHAKYQRFLNQEKTNMSIISHALKKMQKEKYEFYVMPAKNGVLTKEQQKELPQGKIYRGDADKYIQADKEMLETSLRYDATKIKVEFLQSIMSQISHSQYYFSNVLAQLKHEDGS
jgi:hypothetical protein